MEATAHYLTPMERNIVSQDKSLSSSVAVPTIADISLMF